MRGNGQRRDRPRAELLEHAVQHRLDRREHVLLGDERHFEIELVELARRTVGPRILVAEARGDLEVAVEAGHHDELLELLRGLRQGVEFARMDAARHQEVAGAFGRARGEDRCLEFGEPLLDHAPADAGDDGGAQHDVAVHLLAAEIEETVAKPGILGVVLLAEHRHRQLRGDGLHGQLADAQLDMAGRDRVVDRVVAALDDGARDRHDALRAQGVDRGKRLRPALDDALGDAVVVAEIDEEQMAVVALAVDPAREARRSADMLATQFTAGMGSVGMHARSSRLAVGGPVPGGRPGVGRPDRRANRCGIGGRQNGIFGPACQARR